VNNNRKAAFVVKPIVELLQTTQQDWLKFCAVMHCLLFSCWNFYVLEFVASFVIVLAAAQRER